jgi:DNA-binding PadR family transcriptional regulator
MKKTLIINQEMAIKLGMKNSTQAHIFDLLTVCSSWADMVIYENQTFYFTARQMIRDQLPFLSISTDTVYRHLRELDELGLILYRKKGKKDLTRITELGQTYLFDYVGKNSENPISEKNPKSKKPEKNPKKVGKKSESDSEKIPTDKSLKNNKAIKKNDVQVIFDFWREQLDHPRARLVDGDARERKIRVILKNYSVDECKEAILGCKFSAWHMGDNKDGKKYDSIDLIFRGADKIDNFREIYHQEKGKEGSKIKPSRDEALEQIRIRSVDDKEYQFGHPLMFEIWRRMVEFRNFKGLDHALDYAGQLYDQLVDDYD